MPSLQKTGVLVQSTCIDMCLCDQPPLIISGSVLLMGFSGQKGHKCVIAILLLREKCVLCVQSWEGENKRKPAHGFPQKPTELFCLMIQLRVFTVYAC